MAPDALSLFGIEEQLPPALGITGSCQSRLGELFMLGARTLASEAQLKLGIPFRRERRDHDQKSVRTFGKSRGESVGIYLRSRVLIAPMDCLAVEQYVDNPTAR